jgi:pyruvate kinase
VGKYPVAAVDYMARIAVETERGLRENPRAEGLDSSAASDSEIVAEAAFFAARAAGAQAIVVFTEFGYSARLISRYRPPVKIIAMTNSLDVVRRLLVNYAVTPVVAPEVKTTDEMLGQMDTLLVERGLLCSGDKVVFVAGTPVGSAGSTNLMKLHRVS